MLLLFRFKEEKMLLQLLLKEAPMKHSHGVRIIQVNDTSLNPLKHYAFGQRFSNISVTKWKYHCNPSPFCYSSVIQCCSAFCFLCPMADVSRPRQ